MALAWSRHVGPSHLCQSTKHPLLGRAELATNSSALTKLYTQHTKHSRQGRSLRIIALSYPIYPLPFLLSLHYYTVVTKTRHALNCATELAQTTSPMSWGHLGCVSVPFNREELH